MISDFSFCSFRSKSAEKSAVNHQQSYSVSSTQPFQDSTNQRLQVPTPSGGFGKWLREHLTPNHHNNQHHHQQSASKVNNSNVECNDKLTKQRQQCQPSQNLYCSLPRERKLEQRRASCRIVDHHQKNQAAIEDGGRRKSRNERRRHSMSEFQSEQNRARRRERLRFVQTEQ